MTKHEFAENWSCGDSQHYNEIMADLNQLENEPEKISPFPISKVVFFKLIDGKYVASNGIEVTTEFLFNHEHSIYHDSGYVVIERK